MVHWLTFPAFCAGLVIAILIARAAPPVLRILPVFAWLVWGHGAVAVVAKKVLLWRASLAGESLSVAVTPDALAVKLGSEVVSLDVAPFRGVLVREFRTPSLTKYAVHLARSIDCIVPIAAWIDWATAFELGQALSRVFNSPLTAQYCELVDMTCVRFYFSPYRPLRFGILRGRRPPPTARRDRSR